jgi:hypothetical protein
MAYSYTLFTGNGSTTQYAVAFGYIRREHVAVTVAGSPATFTWVNSSLIQMDTAPANGAAVRVYRVTPLDAPLVDFTDGATLVAADLDTNAKQSIYTQQELDDSLVDGLAGVIPNGDKGDITTSVSGSVWTIDAGAVVEAKVATGAITEAKVGTGAITETKVGAGAITEAKVATGAITEAKVATGAITETKVATGAITETKVGAGAITTAKLASVIAPTVSSLNGGPLAGFRNRIINGNFDFWQRGTSFTSSEYGADRWGHGRIGTTHTVTQQAFTLGQTAVPNEPTYFCRTVVTSVAGAGNTSQLFQRIEDVRTFAGQQVTVSFWAKIDATKNISIELTQDFGTGGSPSATVTAIGTTKVSIGTSWQKVTVTATVPSISGKTLGTDNNSYLTVNIWFDAGSSFNSRTDSLGQQSGTFEIAQVQVEPGPVATPFEHRPIGTELALCQRYYYQTSQPNDFYGRAGTVAATTYHPIIHEFPVIMRIAPNYSTAAATFTSANASAFSNTTTPRRHLTLIGLSNTPDLDAYFFLATGSLTWSAEL